MTLWNQGMHPFHAHFLDLNEKILCEALTAVHNYTIFFFLNLEKEPEAVKTRLITSKDFFYSDSNNLKIKLAGKVSENVKGDFLYVPIFS